MVEPNKAGGAGEESKASASSKVQIPDVNAAVNEEEEKKILEPQDVDGEENEDGDEEDSDEDRGLVSAAAEEIKGKTSLSAVDQSKSNIPIPKPDLDCLLELLEQHFKELPSVSEM